MALGLATRVADDPVGAALDLARTIAGKNPMAIRGNRQLLNALPGLSEAEALALETELQLTLLGSKNQMEAVMANMQKRAPRFADPE